MVSAFIWFVPEIAWNRRKKLKSKLISASHFYYEADIPNVFPEKLVCVISLLYSKKIYEYIRRKM
jgi:hypothetical protein